MYFKGLLIWGLVPPYPEYDERRFDYSFYEDASYKNALPSEALTRQPSDPIRDGKHQKRNLIPYLTHTK